MAEIMQRVLFELERDRQLSECGLDNLKLRPENMLLRSDRQLPPVKPQEMQDEPDELQE